MFDRTILLRVSRLGRSEQLSRYRGSAVIHNAAVFIFSTNARAARQSVIIRVCSLPPRSNVRTYAVGVPSLRQGGILHFNVCGFSARSAENRTPTIGTYHAAAGKKCGFEMRNNATA